MSQPVESVQEFTSRMEEVKPASSCSPSEHLLVFFCVMLL